MDRHIFREKLGAVALALALTASGGRALGAPPAPAGTLERAETLVQTRSFEQAATVLRRLLSVDPANRRAEEMLAFALESMGDLEGERRTRSALAARFPDDPRIQTDYGRVLERAGDEGGALRAYRNARKLNAGRPSPDLDLAIQRMRGRTALEVGAPLGVLSDPEATASFGQAGAAFPLGSRRHLAVVARRNEADARAGPATTRTGALALTLVQRNEAGPSWAAGPWFHAISPSGGSRDVAGGGAVEARSPLGPSLEADAKAEVGAPWDEAAVTMLRGGRSTAAEGHVYAHSFARRLLLQAGARRRELSILAADPSSGRPKARQTLRIAGADFVVWRNPGAAVRGEMLDEALVSPTTLSSALTLAYRHYSVSTRATPEFASVIGLVPRGSVDEASFASTLASPRRNFGLDLSAGLAHDSARQARVWRAGGRLIWAVTSATRVTLGYERATEISGGLTGQRRAGSVSLHADF